MTNVLPDRTRLAEAAFDELPDQVAVLDTDGVIRATNRSWGTFGSENGLEVESDMVGENYLSVCRTSNDEMSSAAADGIQSVISESNDSFSLEYPCHTPDEDRWFIMRVTPFGLTEEPLVLVVHTDITDRRRAETTVTERNELLEQVAGILSHDLRNPLSVALAHAEMELEGEAPEENHAARIKRSLDRMNAIIDDALLLARETELTDVESVDLETVARDAWAQVETDGATLRVPETALVEADESLLAQLFENLFRNAVEHGSGDSRSAGDGSDGDHSDLTVTVEPREDGFMVADDGVGIPAEKQDAVFESGFSTNKDDGGTGLGLPIVRQIADAHGWRAGVSTGSDDGAVFVVDGVTLLD